MVCGQWKAHEFLKFGVGFELWSLKNIIALLRYNSCNTIKLTPLKYTVHGFEWWDVSNVLSCSVDT